MKTKVWKIGTFILLTTGLMFFMSNPQINAQPGPPSEPPGCPPQNICVAEGGGFPADGTDMWITAMGELGLFTPHADNCDIVTEAFIQVTASGNGFCIEKNERGALTYDLARHSCLQNSKRLPEPIEWRFACNDAVNLSINNIIGGQVGEWTSNFIKSLSNSNSGRVQGENGCNDWDVPFPNQVAEFRCVR